MDDLDDVRAFLGYDKINIYGGSYGTRAGAGLHAPAWRPRPRRDSRRRRADRHAPAAATSPATRNARFELLTADCAADAGCNAAYPNLLERMRALIVRLEKIRRRST